MTQSTSWRRFRAVCIVVGIVTVVGLPTLSRSISAEDQLVDKNAAKQKTEHLERMRKVAQSIHVFEVRDDKRVETILVDQPILAYRDDTRKQDDSTMWIWGNKGRPSAMLAVEYYPQFPIEKRWLFEIASLSAGQIAAERGQDLHWQARKSGLNLQPLADADVPAGKATTRLAQMRQLRRRFTAHEREGTNGRIELQPLAAPLHRYQDPQQGIIDGAVFAFANGTNPEVLWIIEAHGKPGAPSTWQFGLAQMTGAEVFVQLDNKEIWTRAEADPPAERESYINGWMPETPAPRERQMEK